MVMDGSKGPSPRGRLALAPKSEAMAHSLFELSKRKEVCTANPPPPLHHHPNPSAKFRFFALLLLFIYFS
jgi:hypothetical protein